MTLQRFTKIAEEGQGHPANAKLIASSSQRRGTFYCLGFRNKTLKSDLFLFPHFLRQRLERQREVPRGNKEGWRRQVGGELCRKDKRGMRSWDW